MYTEEEAKQRWCPFIRIHIGEDGGAYHNRPKREDGSTEAKQDSVRCIASQCMAWRTHTDHSEERDWYVKRPIGKTVEEHTRSHGPCPAPIMRGYCGLAGKVEP